MFLGASACMATEADAVATRPTYGPTADEPATVTSAHLAMQTIASAEPGENAGSFENGAGALLSAIGDAAILTVYVVTPAEIVTFERSKLRLTSQQAAGEVTETTELETVTLEAGESWSFSEQADGTLMNAAAEIDAVVL